MSKKPKTNEVAFKELIKNLDPILLACLRERVLTICEHTEQESKNWGDDYFIHPNLYARLNQEVKKYLGFDD